MKSYPFYLLSVLLYLGLVTYGHSGLSAMTYTGLFWPAAGFLMALLVVTPYNTWPPLIAGAFLSEEIGTRLILQNELWTWQQSDLFFANEIGPTLAALLAKRWIASQPRWYSLTGLWRIWGCGIVLGATLAASLGTIGQWERLETHSIFAYWTTWWLTDALGVAAVAPCALWTWEVYRKRPLGDHPKATLESVLSTILCLGFVAYVFVKPQGIPQPFFLFPPLIWLAARQDPVLISQTMVAMIFMTSTLTKLGLGPFLQFGLEPRSTSAAQMFMLTLTLSTLTISCVFSDRRLSLSQKIHVRKELSHSERDYQTLLEHAPVAILLVSEETIERANPAACKLFKRSQAELRVPLTALSAPRQDPKNNFSEFWPDNIQESVILRWSAVNTEGEVIQTELYPSLIHTENGPKIQLVVVDKSEQFKLRSLLERERLSLRDQVIEGTAELERTHRQLAKANEARERFVATISHELRTPLSGILGNSETLQERLWGPLTPEQDIALQRISESGRYLTELVNDLLDLTTLEDSSRSPRHTANTVRALCESSVRLVKNMADEKQVSLEVSPLPETIVDLDGRIVKQILVNLLGNAIKFTQEGGRAGLEVRLSECEMSLIVWDTGPGLSESVQRNIYQPFTRADESIPGFGLGLSLVRQQTLTLNGRIEYETKPGEGTKFLVHLPLGQGLQDMTDSTAPEATPFSVLLVESEPQSLALIDRYLDKCGYRCHRLSYPIEVTNEQIKISFDLLLIQHTGLSSTEEILQKLSYARSSDPVIFVLTKEYDDVPTTQLHELGVTTILGLPIPLPDLERTMLNHLRSGTDLKQNK